MSYGAPIAVSSIAGGQNGATTTGINSTGGNLAIIGISAYRYSNFGGSPVSDNFGNTYTAGSVANGSSSGASVQLWYCYNPTVGSGHTATVAGTNTLSTVVLAVYSGATSSPLDQQAAHESNSGTTIAAGSITPLQNNELIIAYVGADATNTFTAPTGFTIDAQGAGSSGNYIGSAIAHQIQTTATPVNPTWSVVAPFSANSAVIASFKAASGGTTSITADFGGAFEFLSGTSADAGAPTESNARLLVDAEVPAEWRSALRGDLSSPIESSSRVQVDSSNPIEALATVRSDNSAPLESAGAISVTFDGSAPLEWLAALRVDASAPVETKALVRRDLAAPVEASARLSADAAAAVEALTRLSADSSAPSEFAGALVVTSNSGAPFEVLSGVVFHASVSAETLTRALVDSGLPTESVARLAVDGAVPLEIMARIQADRAAPAEISGGVIVTGNAGVPIEWLSALVAAGVTEFEFDGASFIVEPNPARTLSSPGRIRVLRRR